ncbi:Hypothetical predicted protein [Olea europaea subsp. europaea]|uniref:Major facilitator superfamily (MFS) profile domain-containing protein n=1 Tax=Olea europaea subsp. europaea TaxID=158383 RepID=A0A8S0SM53_OLEEU|nr:Hypothetical predicted protein [Olea europaea subsp. europaea]
MAHLQKKSIVQCILLPYGHLLGRSAQSGARNCLWVFPLGRKYLPCCLFIFFQVAVSRALNGIGLAIVTPAIQSLVADSTDGGSRAQGVTGSFPWSALSFSPMWLELSGFSHTKTAILMGIFVVAILFLSLPTNPSTMFLHGFIMSTADSPVFAAIVPEKSRTAIYALDQSFESMLSSFAPPVVGLLAQYVYGYKPVPEGSEDIATGRRNATSLAQALFIAVSIPMALCCIIYSFLHLTYPRDRERAQMKALIEPETPLVEFNSTRTQLEEFSSPRPRRDYFQARSSERKILDDRVVVDMHYDNDGLDFDDEEEEKTLVRQRLKFSNSGKTE